MHAFLETGQLTRASVHACAAPQFASSDLKVALKEAQKNAMRQLLRDERLRSDGRAPDQVRTISSEAGLLPRVHGSSMFTRGETQAIAVVTLGGESDAQRVDELTGADKATRRFYLNYFFPPSCVGEARRARSLRRACPPNAVTRVCVLLCVFPFVCADWANGWPIAPRAGPRQPGRARAVPDPASQRRRACMAPASACLLCAVLMQAVHPGPPCAVSVHHPA